ncbi:hypothetical protein BH09VER1_BH09VER1_35620 [soil metagenome]
MQPLRSDSENVTNNVVNDRKWAKALHDGPCQHLQALSLFSEILAQQLNDERHPLAEQAGKMKDLLKKTTDELRTITRQSPTYVPRPRPKHSEAEKPIVEVLRTRYE